MLKPKFSRHCEPTGRANARPMTGSAKQSSLCEESWIASSLTLLAMTTAHPSRHARPRASQDDDLRRDDFLPLLAEPFDAERDHVAGVEEFRCRLHAGADAGWGSRGDDVARQQCEELRDVGDALGDGEDHGRGRSSLTAFAVDVAPHRQFLHVRYLVLGDEPGAERAEGVVRLALGPLTQTLDLEIALGHVVAD